MAIKPILAAASGVICVNVFGKRLRSGDPSGLVSGASRRDSNDGTASPIRG
jgi:hypothetical protein